MKTLFFFLVSAGLLTVIQPPISLSFLAWVSLVPFILACSPDIKPLRLFFTVYIVSLAFWLGNLYWVGFVTWPGWFAYCMYQGLLWPLVALGIRYSRKRNIPLFFCAAILFVAAESMQGFLLGGFYWHFLAHSQYQNISLIQIADIFGTPGISFLIAMVNGLLADFIILNSMQERFTFRDLLKVAFVLGCLLAVLFYGRWRIGQTPESLSQGPVVDVVQTNVPQIVKESVQDSGMILNDLLDISRKARQANPELIIWPETMVLSILDPRVLRYLPEDHLYVLYDQVIREHAKSNAYLLVGATGAKPKFLADGTIDLLAEQYNSAFVYQPDGEKSTDIYSKIHLVPFGEVVPFKKSIPWLHDLLLSFTPYDYDYTLDYGNEYTVFSMDSNSLGKTFRFSVLICYEDTVPELARGFVLDDEGNKQIDWFVNISNDGWFVAYDKKTHEITPRTELVQHMAVCVFRAVENRVCVIRSVNTGISCLIDSSGRIKNNYIDGNLPVNAADRQGISGWFADKMPIDKRITVFSRYGQWLDIVCLICIGVVVFIELVAKRRKKTRENEKQKLQA